MDGHTAAKQIIKRSPLVRHWWKKVLAAKAPPMSPRIMRLEREDLAAIHDLNVQYPRNYTQRPEFVLPDWARPKSDNELMLEMLKEEDEARHKAMKDKEAQLHSEYIPPKVVAEVTSATIHSSGQQVKATYSLKVSPEAIFDALVEDQERLQEAAKKTRQRKKYLAEIHALFSAALERDITRQATLDVVMADITRLEKKLGLADKQEANEPEVEVEDKRMKYAEDSKLPFEEEQRRIKKAEREAASNSAGGDILAMLKKNTITLAH